MPGPQAGTGDGTQTAERPPRLGVLRKRSDFLAARTGRKAARPGFVLQARERAPAEADPELVRVGFTCSKKVGNAVTRNRARRRLREVARLILPAHGRPGWDYVLVGRRDSTIARDFSLLQDDLAAALARIHGKNGT
ncbi:MAG: ribonuclease P protein component [Paracoccaceae bacterium]